MANSYFQFKQFTIQQENCAMKVTTDACLFGSLCPTFDERKEVFKVLDIGTGTGLLSLMFAQKKQSAVIDAVEIDEDAFQQATENVAASPWSHRIKVIHTDAKEFDSGNQYDFIISNPPFYEKELKSDDAKKNLAHHNKGLLLPELLNAVKKNLKPGGRFSLLLPYKRNEEIKRMMSDSNLFIQQLTFVRQSATHDYFRIILSGKLTDNEPAETIIDEISIKDKNNQYTPEFTALLKDYYLHL